MGSNSGPIYKSLEVKLMVFQYLCNRSLYLVTDSAVKI